MSLFSRLDSNPFDDLRQHLLLSPRFIGSFRAYGAWKHLAGARSNVAARKVRHSRAFVTVLCAGKELSVAGGERVVVVDGLSDIGEVLKAVLEPRGVCVEQMRKTSNGRFQGERFRPSVVVVDEDAANGSRVRLECWPKVPQVVIGSANIPANISVKGGDCHYLQKPFQYRELIQAIERLLGDR